MTASKKAVICGVALTIIVSGITSSIAADCTGFFDITNQTQTDLGLYGDRQKDKIPTDREICGAMKDFFSDAEVILKNDYSSCTPKKQAYDKWRKDIQDAYTHFKNDDFKYYRCSRFTDQ